MFQGVLTLIPGCGDTGYINLTPDADSVHRGHPDSNQEILLGARACIYRSSGGQRERGQGEESEEREREREREREEEREREGERESVRERECSVYVCKMNSAINYPCNLYAN